MHPNLHRTSASSIPSNALVAHPLLVLGEAYQAYNDVFFNEDMLIYSTSYSPHGFP
jgi:hypothetical protein